jgi:DNA-directed RNA polymerase subunit omega
MARVTVEDCLPMVENRFALTTRNKATVQSLREIATGKVRFDRSVRDALAGKFDREKPVAAATPGRSK